MLPPLATTTTRFAEGADGCRSIANDTQSSWYVGTAQPQISKRYLGTDLDIEWRAIDDHPQGGNGASGRTYLCRKECVHSDHKASGDECLWLTHE
jgi:hypothetical protein